MTAQRVQIQAFIDSALSPAARSAVLADAARSMVRDLITDQRAVPDYVTYVDGRQGADEGAVRGDGSGTILYRFNYLGRAAAFALSFLQSRGPGGKFAQSFYVGVDGRFIPAAGFNPDSVPPTAEVVIGNTQPYSRRVDVQMDGNTVLHFSVPAGMFADCVRAVRRPFGGVIKAKRVYSMRFPGQYMLRRGAKAGQPVHSPAVVLTAVQ